MLRTDFPVGIAVLLAFMSHSLGCSAMHSEDHDAIADSDSSARFDAARSDSDSAVSPMMDARDGSTAHPDVITADLTDVTVDHGTIGDGGVHANHVAFPLVASANGRYLQDQNGRPFRLQGDAAWDASVSLTLAQLRAYLDDRRAKGFTAILVQITDPVKYQPNATSPASVGAAGALPFLRNSSGGTWDGDPGFNHFDADFSSPNDAYFAWIDTLLAEAAARDIVVVLTACYLGYNNGAEDGWWQTLNNQVNTQTVSLGFGRYLGNRYRDVPNIIWEAGVDMLPPPGSEGETRAHKILEGIQAAGDTHLWTGHWVHDYVSTDEAAFASDMDIEGVYTHGNYPQLGPTYGRSRQGYDHQPALPTILLETNYEGEHGATPAQVREFMWGAQLSTIGGVIFGNLPVWDFANGWEAALNSVGAGDMQRMGQLLDSLPWNRLVPSGLAGSHTWITAGSGTFTNLASPGAGESGGDDWVVSAASDDGLTLIAYVPDPHRGAITVDLSVLAGAATASWFDPTNGTTTAIGSVANSGTRSFTTPGANSGGSLDWVLTVIVQ